MKRNSGRNRGFLLIEMLAAIVLLTAFGLVAAPLFSEIMHVIARAPAAQDAMTRFESVAKALREDAWGARSFIAVGADVIQIDLSNGSAIRWQIDSDGDIERVQGSQRRRWIGVGANAVFEIDGACAVLRATGRAADGYGEIRFPSVLQLAAAGGTK